MKDPSTAPRARIVVVDDHPAVREALAQRIEREADLQICGEASNVAEALTLIQTLQPDVAVIDITLEGGDGLDLIKRIKDRNDQIRLLVWSMHNESLYAERALRAGALGYVRKDQATEQIIQAIRRVLEGKVWLSEPMAERLFQRAVGNRLQQQVPIETLSDRELEVLRLIGEGSKTVDIAEQLHLSVKTVETYRERIRQKLGLSDGTKLTHYATRWVLDPGPTH